jgi:NitT/TauT family transport system permease protein
MTVAYALSLAFTLVYGHRAAFDRRAERILLPLLDVLQSVPILSSCPSCCLALLRSCLKRSLRNSLPSF